MGKRADRKKNRQIAINQYEMEIINAMEKISSTGKANWGDILKKGDEVIHHLIQNNPPEKRSWILTAGINVRTKLREAVRFV